MNMQRMAASRMWLRLLGAACIAAWSGSSVALSTSGLTYFSLNAPLQSTDCRFAQRFLRRYPEISFGNRYRNLWHLYPGKLGRRQLIA